MNKLLFRLIVGLGFALPMLLITSAWARADLPARPASTTNCYQCHDESFQSWNAGAHGQAGNNAKFQADWKLQGQPEQCLACHTTGYDPRTGAYQASGVTCLACHSPIPNDHPNQPVPTNRSERTCATCHANTLLEWQTSAHKANNLTCIDCHDAHNTRLKAASSSGLCINCHKDHQSKVSHPGNNAQGLSCADCHLGREETTGADVHIARNHSFTVQLSTCTRCHADAMHNTAVQTSLAPTATPQPGLAAAVSGPTPAVQPEPEPVSPTGFAALAIVLGFGGGVVVSPWLERWYRNQLHH
jgi:hypothetical protein